MQNDYPTLKNQGTNVVHKTKSYWKSKENKQGDDIKEKQRKSSMHYVMHHLYFWPSDLEFKKLHDF